MATENKTPVIVVCKACGGADVARDAWAEWSVASQDWELRAVMDQGYCHDCDGESRLITRPATADELE